MIAAFRQSRLRNWKRFWRRKAQLVGRCGNLQPADHKVKNKRRRPSRHEPQGGTAGAIMKINTSRSGVAASVLAAAASAIVLFAVEARAQEFPAKPITVIVPFPAGGSTDITLRAIAEVAGKHLGQPVLIDNKAGGSGTVGPATM